MVDGFNNIIPVALKKGVDFLSTPTVKVDVPVMEAEPIIETIETPPPPITPPQEPVTITEPPLTEEEVEESAELVIEFINMVQELAMGYLAKRKRTTKAEEIAGDNAAFKLKEVATKVKANLKKEKQGIPPEAFNTGEEMALEELHTSVEAFLDELEFSEREKKRLMTPLKMIMKKRNKKLSPEALLLIATGMSVGSRIGMLVAI